MSTLPMVIARTMSSVRLRMLLYIPILTSAMGLMMARLLLMARLMSIEVFADLSVGLLVSGTFCMFGCFGLQSRLQRELPVNLLHGQERRGLLRIAQCHIVAIVAAALLLAVSSLSEGFAGISPAVYAAGILHGFSQQLFLIATVESRSRGQPLRYAWENLTRVIPTVGVACGLAWVGASAPTVLLAEALVGLSVSVLIQLRSDSSQRVGIASASLYRLALRKLPAVGWVSALTLMAFGVVGFALGNADRWVAAQILPDTEFARYAFAWITLSVASAMQVVINAAVFPALARRYAAYGKGAAAHVTIVISLGLLISGIICALPVWLLLNTLTEIWFPRYASATALFPFFLLVGVLRVSDFWSSFLIIMGCEKRLLGGNLIAVLVGVFVWWLVLVPATSGASSESEAVALLAVSLVATSYLVAMFQALAVGRSR